MMNEDAKLLVLGKPLPDIVCPHCGKVLHQKVYENENLTAYTPHYEPCGCPGSIAQAGQDRLKAEQRAAKEKEWQHRETVAKLLKKSGIRGRYLEKNLNNYNVTPDNEKAFKSALKYVQKFSEMRKNGMGLFLSGECGVGKTHLATGIARALIEQEYRVICKPSVNMLADIKATYDAADERSEYELLRDYLQADLLIIDDLGKELITDWSLSMLYTVLNMRYEDRRPLIITTNYSDEGLIERLSRKGDRVTAVSMVSRLHEISYSVEVLGEDFRSK